MKLVQVNISANEIILFTPLPQMHMANSITYNNVLEIDQIITLEYGNAESISKIFFDIAELKPDVVTFSTYMWNFKIVDQLSYSLKDWSSNKCWIIWGGPHISEDPHRFMKEYFKSVDFIVAWYGEKPIIQILMSWKQNKGNLRKSKDEIEFKNFKGIYFVKNLLSSNSQIEIKNSEDYIFGHKAGDFIPLTELSEAYNYEKLPSHIKDNISERVFMLESYRGCPFSCAYCLWGVASKKIDFLSSERIIDEFDNLINYGARQFNLADAGFGLKKERDVAFLKHLLEVKKSLKIDINLSGYWFWQTLSDEMLELMKEIIDQGIMGQLDVGIQTFNLEVTKIMKRPTNYKSFDVVLNKAKALDIPFQMDLILGLPGDNFKGFLHSVKQVMNYGPNKFQTFPLSIWPGSDYDRRRSELGIKTVQGSRTMDIDSIVETKSFKRKEIVKALRVESYFYLTYTLRLLNKTIQNIGLASDTSFFDITIKLYEWSTRRKNSIFNLTSHYYESLYENRHLGRKNLDLYLFDNLDEIHTDLIKFIKYIIKNDNDYKIKPDKYDYLFELLKFELMIFPKRFKIITDLKTFDNIIDINSGDKEIIANFKSQILYNLYFPAKKIRSVYKVKYKEPVSNFREGGISTQYNFWKWQYSITS